MAVLITDICISCGACIDECPVGAIEDEEGNPEGKDIYYVYEDKCVECVSFNEEPACANSCPTDGCIVWSDIIEGKPFKEEISIKDRKSNKPVII